MTGICTSLQLHPIRTPKTCVCGDVTHSLLSSPVSQTTPAFRSLSREPRSRSFLCNGTTTMQTPTGMVEAMCCRAYRYLSTPHTFKKKKKKREVGISLKKRDTQAAHVTVRNPSRVLCSALADHTQQEERVRQTDNMAFKQIMAAGAIVLACLVANASAFVTPMTTVGAPATSARSTASGIYIRQHTHACILYNRHQSPPL